MGAGILVVLGFGGGGCREEDDADDTDDDMLGRAGSAGFASRSPLRPGSPTAPGSAVGRPLLPPSPLLLTVPFVPIRFKGFGGGAACFFAAVSVEPLLASLVPPPAWPCE